MKTKKEIKSWDQYVESMMIEPIEHTFDESLQNQEPPVTMTGIVEEATPHVTQKMKCRPEDERLVMMDFTGYDPLYDLSQRDDNPYSIGDFRPSDSFMMMKQREDRIVRKRK